MTTPIARTLHVAAQIAGSDLNPTYAEPIAQLIASIVASGQPPAVLADVAEELDTLAGGDTPGSDNPELEADLARWVRELRDLAAHRPLRLVPNKPAA